MKRYFKYVCFAFLLLGLLCYISSCKNTSERAESTVLDAQIMCDDVPSGAVLVSEENSRYIGSEATGSAVIIPYGSTDKPDIAVDEMWKIPVNDIFTKMHTSEMVPPFSVSIFELKNEGIPEIIMTNGAMAIMTNVGQAGWMCKNGDVISGSLERYPTNTKSTQPSVVGYIRDGICYDGNVFDDLSGVFEMVTSEEGEYYVYIMSLASDYLTLKGGEIGVEVTPKK